MNDLQIGDKCTVRINAGVLMYGIIVFILGEKANIYFPKENDTGQFNLNDIERHPRPLEMIEVWDSDTWVHREAICGEDGGVWIASPEDGEGAVFFAEYRFLSAKEDKKEIIRRIEENDPDILGELAEIILAAREKVTP
jgi:hypothetical protein